jgi:hypothetical protein
VLLAFLMFLLGVTDFARMLFAWNAATESTRLGARFAVVCADTGSDAQVLAEDAHDGAGNRRHQRWPGRPGRRHAPSPTARA